MTFVIIQLLTFFIQFQTDGIRNHSHLLSFKFISIVSLFWLGSQGLCNNGGNSQIVR
jgi:hypothetical protein